MGEDTKHDEPEHTPIATLNMLTVLSRMLEPQETVPEEQSGLASQQMLVEHATLSPPAFVHRMLFLFALSCVVSPMLSCPHTVVKHVSLQHSKRLLKAVLHGVAAHTREPGFDLSRCVEVPHCVWKKGGGGRTRRGEQATAESTQRTLARTHKQANKQPNRYDSAHVPD
jgi:hypothetical protein